MRKRCRCHGIMQMGNPFHIRTLYLFCAKSFFFKRWHFVLRKNGKKAEKSFRWCVFCFRVRLLTHITLKISFHANIFSFFLHPSTYPILPSHSKPIHLRSHANKIHFCDLFQFFLMLSYIYQQHFIANIHVTMVSVSIYAK